MKLTLVILLGMVVLAAVVPAAMLLWGLPSAATILLVVAVLGFELSLACVLLWRFRERQRLTRFGVPLQHRHFPMHDGPLPGSPTARRRRSAPPDTQ